MASFLTVEEFGEAMHLKHSQAYYLLASGRAPSVRINGRRLVPNTTAAVHGWAKRRL